MYDEENEKWTRDAETIEPDSFVRVKVTSVNQQAQSIVSLASFIIPPTSPLTPPIVIIIMLTVTLIVVRAGDRREVRLSVRCACCGQIHTLLIFTSSLRITNCRTISERCKLFSSSSSSSFLLVLLLLRLCVLPL